MNSILRCWPLLLALAMITACQSQVEKVDTLVTNKFQDEEIVSIYTFIDKRDTDSLLSYLRHENANYRYEAALGFGSIQDSSALRPLAMALNDESPKVRKAAAYALGQLRDTAAIAPIVASLEAEDSLYVRQELLEALGKVVTQQQLRMLQYWPLKTSEDKQGLAWGLYRAGVRNVHDGISVDLALSLLDSSNTYLTRLGAAHFLSRARNVNLTGRSAFLIKSATTDVSPFVRMAATSALRHAVEPSSLKALSQLVKAADYRIRINALRALSAFDFEETKTLYFEALEDPLEQVAVAASEILLTKITVSDESNLTKLSEAKVHWRAKANVLAAWLKISENKTDVIEVIKAAFLSAKNDYYKAALLQALGESYFAHEFVITQTFSSENKAISTAGISALANMRSLEGFPENLIKPFADIFKEAIETKDIAMIAIAGSVLTNPELQFKETYENVDFLKEVKKQLSLPQDIEALQMLDRAIAFFDDTVYKAPENEYNHPINWEKVKALGQSPVAIIKTEKGDITLRLLIEDAPGSVANFAELAQSGYYNGKNFHRVVPNFVIQGGCNRGDGYGGEDYSIRSELANLKYEEGSVGMASAGKDTEGTQWFITHSPTPHLDGSYTIFARVTEGLEVVHRIEMGDKILEINIK